MGKKYSGENPKPHKESSKKSEAAEKHAKAAVRKAAKRHK